MNDFTLADAQHILDTVMTPWLDELGMTVEAISETALSCVCPGMRGSRAMAG